MDATGQINQHSVEALASSGRETVPISPSAQAGRITPRRVTVPTVAPYRSSTASPIRTTRRSPDRRVGWTLWRDYNGRTEPYKKVRRVGADSTSSPYAVAGRLTFGACGAMAVS
jgi:hypothetical protein